MEIRKTTVQDVDTVMEIIDQAKNHFKTNHIDQWQDGYPNRKTILEDIVQGISFVLVEESEIMGTAAISFFNEETYDVIEGEWLNNEPYIVIHRIAVSDQYKGKNIAVIILDYADLIGQLRKVYNIRIDTHKDNHAMQRFLLKNNFTFCGIITLHDGAKRLAFHRVR